MKTHLLKGCNPEPLIHYLKALGVLRLVSRQADPEIRGWWEGNRFTITTALSQEELLDFFLNRYVPSPIVAPWNGGSGFYGKKAQEYLETIVQSSSPRLAYYRKTIAICREIIIELGLKEKPGKNDKIALLKACRSRLPDLAVEAMDSLYVYMNADSSAKFSPLLGSGGNDGNLEFTYTFFKYVQRVISLDDSPACKESSPWLAKSLLDEGSPALEKDSVGQYLPGGIGGPNSTRGFQDGSRVNPWDYVLAFEGILAFSGAASRRLAGSPRGRMAAFPFTVDASAAGWGTMNENEADDKSRGEIWLPLWGKPACYPEIEYLFSEGRAQVGKRQATSGVDFARAVASLGIDRGIVSFQRIGFLAGDRSGKAHLAANIGSFPVTPQPNVLLINELDSWLGKFRSAISGPGSPARYRNDLRNIEEAIFAYCRHGGEKRLQSILLSLGAASQSLSLNPAFHSGPKAVPPLRLRPHWLASCYDGSVEFRIAASLASIVGTDDLGGIRENLEPVTWDKKRGQYVWLQGKFHVFAGGLPRILAGILEKRMLWGDRLNLESPPIKGLIEISPADVGQYLAGLTDEAAILALLRGLSLIDLRWMERANLPRWAYAEGDCTPMYSLLKLIFLPGKLKWPDVSKGEQIRPEVSILSHLSGGNYNLAARTALRRLKSMGFTPKLDPRDADSIIVTPDEGDRLAGALLIPVGQSRLLAKKVLVGIEMKGVV